MNGWGRTRLRYCSAASFKGEGGRSSDGISEGKVRLVNGNCGTKEAVFIFEEEEEEEDRKYLFIKYLRSHSIYI